MSLSRPFLVTEKKQQEVPAHLKIGVRLAPRDEAPRAKKKFEGYKNAQLEEKRKVALDALGTHWKLHPNTTYVSRSEFFLTRMFREIVRRKPTSSIISASVMSGGHFKKVVAETIEDNDRVYVGDLKILGKEEMKIAQ